MAKSRLELRREVEAADAQKKENPTRKKAAKRKSTARKTREKAPERKRAVWVVYDGSMKEHGRFAYDQKKEAEEKLEALRQRGKKLYFMQMVKELLTADARPISSGLTSVREEDDPILDEDDDVKVKAPRTKSNEDGVEVETDFEDPGFVEEEEDEDEDAAEDEEEEDEDDE